MRRIDGVSSSRLSRAVTTSFHEHPALVIFALLLAALTIFFLAWVAFSVDQPGAIVAGNKQASIPLRPQIVTSPPELPAPTEPAHLAIPVINLSAAIENVGLTKKGAMSVPKNTNNVGWFSLGYRPGEVGNAVLTGHVDTLWLRPAVFAKLNILKIGDELTVTDQQSHAFTFIVRKVASYNVNELPLATIFGTAPVPQLNLITCSGKWSWKIATYTERTVVYTSLK